MQEKAYVAVAPCGCMKIMMTADHAATKDGRASITKALRDGLAIERVPYEQIKTSRTYCETCDPARVARKRQMTLEVK
jgi:hypothetical protein